jgi:hypothetical protein
MEVKIPTKYKWIAKKYLKLIYLQKIVKIVRGGNVS